MYRWCMRRIHFCIRTMVHTTGTGTGGGHCILLRGQGVLITQDPTMGGVGGAVEGGGRGTVEEVQGLGLVQGLGAEVCLEEGEWVDG